MIKQLGGGLALVMLLSGAQAAIYSGNGTSDGGFGGAVGNGTLTMTDNGGTVSVTFARGTADFLSDLVIFIDSISGGYSSTAGFTDAATRPRRSISGLDGTGNQSIATFAGDFAADFAITLAAHSQNRGGELFQLVAGGSHLDKGSVNLSPTDTSTSVSYTFSFNLSDIGITPGQGASFRFQTTYIGDDGFRSLESFESVNGNRGWDTVSFDNFNTYLTALPELTNSALVIFAGIAWLVFILRRKADYRQRLTPRISPLSVMMNAAWNLMCPAEKRLAKQSFAPAPIREPPVPWQTSPGNGQTCRGVAKRLCCRASIEKPDRRPPQYALGSWSGP